MKNTIQATILLTLTLVLLSCEQSGPPSTNTTSATLTSLSEKVTFLEQYITFKNQYSELEFSVVFHNNAGVPPGPSDFDISIYGKVTEENIQSLLMGKNKIETPTDLSWIEAIPKHKSFYSGTSYEWYQNGQTVLGVNQNNEFLYHIDTYTY